MSTDLVRDRGATVLVVDPDGAAPVASALGGAREAFDVRTATDADAALPQLDAADAVVSDHDAPAVDGLALLERVRDAHGDLPFVLFTAQGSEQVASEAISGGVTDYLRRTGADDCIADLADCVADAVASHRSPQEYSAAQRAGETAHERVLRASPASLDDTLDALDDIFYVFDREGQLAWWSDRLAEVTGYTDAEIAAMSPVEFFVDSEADRSLLERLLTNLFRNSVEHGDGTVLVRAGPLEDRDGFYVEDDGPGIPEADRDRVFDWKHTTKAGGSGIGLRSVEQVVEAHEWSIAITESEAGGARFEVRDVERPD